MILKALSVMLAWAIPGLVLSGYVVLWVGGIYMLIDGVRKLRTLLGRS